MKQYIEQKNRMLWLTQYFLVGLRMVIKNIIKTNRFFHNRFIKVSFFCIMVKEVIDMCQRYRDGWIEVITGCMFAGKTEELIRRVKKLQYARKRVQVFQPIIDTRYSTIEIVSHAGNTIKSEKAGTAEELLRLVHAESDAIAIDEVQFFDEGIVEVLNQLADQGKRVIVAGLDLDYRAKPFGVMPQLMACAEFVDKLSAVCVVCGASATRSYRLSEKTKDVILLGAKETYEARCRHCYIKGRL